MPHRFDVIRLWANLPAMIFWRRCSIMNRILGRKCTSSASAVQFGDELRRSIPLTDEEFRSQKSLSVVQPAKPRFLRVAVIGEPNAGKSTLVNKLLGWRVCSVSAKVHTTRQNAAAVLVEGDKQVVFLDTPGIVSLQQGKKHKLEASLITHPKESFDLADLVLVLVDASNRWTRHRLSEHVLDLLQKYKSSTKSVLVLNKIDSLRSKHRLLDLSRILTCNTLAGSQTVGKEKQAPKPVKTLEEMFLRTERVLAEGRRDEDREEEAEEKREVQGWPNFQKIFMVSALEGRGVGDLRNYLLGSCKRGDWLYHPSVVTDQNPRDMALMVVREKVMEVLPNEMPYMTEFSLQMWQVDPEMGSLKIAVDVLCIKKNAVVRLLGPQGKTVAAIAEAARQELSNTFHCDVMLKLLVQLPPQVGDKSK